MIFVLFTTAPPFVTNQPIALFHQCTDVGETWTAAHFIAETQTRCNAQGLELERLRVTMENAVRDLVVVLTTRDATGTKGSIEQRCNELIKVRATPLAAWFQLGSGGASVCVTCFSLLLWLPS